MSGDSAAKSTLSVPAPAAWISRSFWPLGHGRGEAPADVDVGVAQFVERRHAGPTCQHTSVAGWDRCLEPVAMRQQIRICDNDFHRTSASAGRLLSNVQPGTRYCMAMASSRPPRPSFR